jgi:gliding motility-associated-like protein
MTAQLRYLKQALKKLIPDFSAYFLSGVVILFASSLKTSAQNCPYNIDFETGTFDGWTCYTGYTQAINDQNVITLSPSVPVPDRHTMYTANSGDGVDPYGGFPVNCPNGSRHSIRLGNNLGGGEAEGISYDFTIPANQNVFSLIYHYAVVFQDPNHLEFQQPRMEIEITDITDNILISCSSFTFHPYGSILPGFFLSTNALDSDVPVWCKDWSAVSVDLNGLAGKTIRLFFKTADCTFRRHFGYAYIDVNSECSNEFVGATYCPGDSTIQVTAPYGYQNYTWYNQTFSQVIGSQQVIIFTPPPPAGTTIAVQLMPYNGYGCLDTLYAQLIDTLTVKSNAGLDALSCNHNPVQIGDIPKQGLFYSWSPPTGLSDPTISNPLAAPDTNTSYILTTRDYGGGCVSFDTVLVKASVINSNLILVGKDSFCEGNNDSAVLAVQPTDSIQWYKNDVPIRGANQQSYQAIQSGFYYAMLYNNSGCSISTAVQNIFIDHPKPGITYPVQYALYNLPMTLQARNFGESYLWNPAINLDNPAVFNPVFKGNEDQLYTIQITTSIGCVTVDTQFVKTVPKVEIYVPSAFTPNNDGRNDQLRPVLMGVKELHYFRIYNRWGLLLFETKTDQKGWDGTLQGTPQNTQVVVWEAEGLGVDGTIYKRKGTAILIR